MATLMAIIVIIVLFVIFDHIIYWKRISDFERRANEFVVMFNILSNKVLHGDPNFPDTDEFIFDGDIYKNVTVKKGDFASFYSILSKCIKDVLDSYEKIGERYLSLMDDETEEWIYGLHMRVEEISNTIRYQSWLINGIE